MRTSRKYPLPAFLHNVGLDRYLDWLAAKASAHIKRDKARGNTGSSREEYKVAIHAAVTQSGGRDFYTGQDLRWDLISTYANEESKLNRRAYKEKFALLPTVDHVGDGLGPADFKICAWRTNDAKNDMNHEVFLALCRQVIAHADRK